MRIKYFAPFVLGTSILFGLLSSQALAAFQCPATDAVRSEDGSAVQDIAQNDSPSSVTSGVKKAIVHLQTEGIKSGSIVDRLVAAYCARIAPDSTITDKRKADDVRRFAFNLAGLVYGAKGHDQDAIILSVPVPMALYQQVEQTAKKAKIDQDEWITQAIKRQLQQQ